MATLSALSRPVEKHWPQLGFSSHCTSSWSHQKWQKTCQKIWEVQVCKASVFKSGLTLVKNHLVFDIGITVSLENKWCWGGQLHRTSSLQYLCERTGRDNKLQNVFAYFEKCGERRPLLSLALMEKHWLWVLYVHSGCGDQPGNQWAEELIGHHTY